MELTQAAKDYVVDSGYDPVLRRPTAEEILQSKVKPPSLRLSFPETSGPAPTWWWITTAGS